MRYWLAMLIGLFGAVNAHAALRTETVEYHDGDTVLEGYLAYDDALQGKRPGILVVHEWKGLGSYAKRRADQLAQLGYVAFAVDMYGKGVRAADHTEAGKLSGIYRNDRQLMRRRIQAGLEWLKAEEHVDTTRLGAIGYCFGGTTVLELARSGASVLGVVSFHGGLGTSSPAAPEQVHAKVLVLHGADDSFVSQEEVAAFEQEMQAAGADYRGIQYEGAVHSFTVPEAGNDPSQGMAYNPEADQKSWEEMKAFFKTLFQESDLQNAKSGASYRGAWHLSFSWLTPGYSCCARNLNSG